MCWLSAEIFLTAVTHSESSHILFESTNDSISSSWSLLCEYDTFTAHKVIVDSPSTQMVGSHCLTSKSGASSMEQSLGFFASVTKHVVIGWVGARAGRGECACHEYYGRNESSSNFVWGAGGLMPAWVCTIQCNAIDGRRVNALNLSESPAHTSNAPCHYKFIPWRRHWVQWFVKPISGTGVFVIKGPCNDAWCRIPQSAEAWITVTLHRCLVLNEWPSTWWQMATHFRGKTRIALFA